MPYKTKQGESMKYETKRPMHFGAESGDTYKDNWERIFGESKVQTVKGPKRVSTRKISRKLW